MTLLKAIFVSGLVLFFIPKMTMKFSKGTGSLTISPSTIHLVAHVWKLVHFVEIFSIVTGMFENWWLQLHTFYLLGCMHTEKSFNLQILIFTELNNMLIWIIVKLLRILVNYFSDKLFS